MRCFKTDKTEHFTQLPWLNGTKCGDHSLCQRGKCTVTGNLFQREQDQEQGHEQKQRQDQERELEPAHKPESQSKSAALRNDWSESIFVIILAAYMALFYSRLLHP